MDRWQYTTRIGGFHLRISLEPGKRGGLTGYPATCQPVWGDRYRVISGRKTWLAGGRVVAETGPTHWPVATSSSQ